MDAKGVTKLESLPPSFPLGPAAFSEGTRIRPCLPGARISASPLLLACTATRIDGAVKLSSAVWLLQMPYITLPKPSFSTTRRPFAPSPRPTLLAIGAPTIRTAVGQDAASATRRTASA